MNLGEWVYAQRKKLNISQAKLGKLLNVKQCTISYWESGKNQPYGERLEALEKIFGVPAPSDCRGANSCAPIRNDLELKVEVEYGQGYVKNEFCLNIFSRKLLDFGQDLFGDPAIQAEFAAWQAKGGAAKYEN